MPMSVECGACGQEYDADTGSSCPACGSGNVIYDPDDLPADDEDYR